ncbi:calmodulin-beta-like [Pollicipes pollicipes]|uniref:calmodulin-beta-like n=1 Tax=Pollicipes pollicipes TaxID=41117 RepID=UPI0018857479|nr:calmodulin-beta-like [Pollicipes pollicipes]
MEQPTDGSGCSPAALQALRHQFDLIDQDGNGSITSDELTRVMRELGHHVTDSEVHEIMRAVDADGDGNFTFDEFALIVSKMGPGSGQQSRAEAEQALRDAFRVFDKHGRGFISASDLRAVLQCLGERLSDDDIEAMIDEVDIDGDGRIDFFEFVSAITDDSEVETVV